MERPCSNCGGMLVGVAFERTVVCTYCQTSQPNLDCIAVGQEVIWQDGHWLKLETVSACRGPDEVVVGSKTMKLEDLMPVMRAPDTLEAGTLVYANSVVWERTWTATAARRGEVTVKNANAAFQNSFFNRKMLLSAVRIPVRPGDREHRNARQALLERFKARPFATLLDAIFALVSLVPLLIVAAVIATIIYVFLTGR